MKVYAAVAEVSKGQVVLGVSLTKTGAKQIGDDSIHTAEVFEVTMDEKVKVGDSVFAHMIDEDGERVFDYLSVEPNDKVRTLTVRP